MNILCKCFRLFVFSVTIQQLLIRSSSEVFQKQYYASASKIKNIAAYIMPVMENM